MDNFTESGEVLEFTAPGGGVVSGNGYKIGSLVVIATVAALATEKFQGITRGVVRVPKPDDEVWTQLEKIYWDNSAKKFTTVSGGNTLVGVAVGVPAEIELTAVENVGSDGMGVDGLEITITDYLELAGATLTVTIAGVDHDLLEDATGSADWEAITSNDATATSLAAAIDALDGVSAAAVGNVVTVTIDGGVQAEAGAPDVGSVRLDGVAR